LELHKRFPDLFAYFVYGAFPAIFRHFSRATDAKAAVLFISTFFEYQRRTGPSRTQSTDLAAVFLLNAFSFRQHCANTFFYRFHYDTADPLSVFRESVCESVPFLPAAHCRLLRTVGESVADATSMFIRNFCVTMVELWKYDPVFACACTDTGSLIDCLADSLNHLLPKAQEDFWNMVAAELPDHQDPEEDDPEPALTYFSILDLVILHKLVNLRGSADDWIFRRERPTEPDDEWKFIEYIATNIGVVNSTVESPEAELKTERLRCESHEFWLQA
jgi:hypothetical protein